MDYKKEYLKWLNNDFFDEKTKQELYSIKDDDNEIKDRFYKNLEFGTAGLRGKIGAGTNRMNIYNISKVTQGIANFIIEQSLKYIQSGVVIAYDCRHYSKEFAKTSALIFAGNNIKCYLFEDLRPTPELSFAVRHLKASFGIVITASHNPKEYNGYKVYSENGAQILSNIAEPITKKINSINDFSKIKTLDEDLALKKGLLTILGKDMDDTYIEKIKTLSLRDNIDKDLQIVYSPLNGTGNIPVRRILRERGFSNIHVVAEQEKPDPDFTTVKYPNPENHKAFEYAENLGKKINAELLLATDPDCDRLAIAVRNPENNYVYLNGNQTGALLIKYVLESMQDLKVLPKNPAIIKSIVTGDLGRAIAKDYGATTFEVLTGFKNIYGKAIELQNQNKYNFILGYEESIGYNVGSFARDKDAVCASMFLCEAASYYKTKGKTLLDVLNDIYTKYGYYVEKQISIVLEGLEGKNRINRMMESYRKDFPKSIGNLKLTRSIDYLNGYKDIPPSNVLKFYLEDNNWYAIRPSGTEPKIKIYIYTKGKTLKNATELLKVIEHTVMNKLNSIN